MIYFVEDDSNIRELVVYTLKSTGFEATGCADGKELDRALEKEDAELILLDIMLPGEGGVAILRRLRAAPATAELPIIMVTARSSEYDKVIGLDSGADDYITKPFGMMELVARVRAVLRRKPAKSEKKGIFEAGDVVLDMQSHTVTADGAPVSLTYKEFELLHSLMENSGRVLSRDVLLETVWGYDFDGETRTVDVHIRTLRNKLGRCGDIIETVRGIGYRIGGGR